MKCPFCMIELEAGDDICTNCKIESSTYSYFQKRALKLIEQSKENYEDSSIAIEILKHSLLLDSKNIFPLKMLGLLYSISGKYDFALHYFKEYNRKINDDPEIEKLNILLKSWMRNLDQFLQVTF